MAQLNAGKSELDFSLNTAWSKFISESDTEIIWETTNGHRIKAIGTGFAYFGALPVGGDVTRIEFDWIDKDHPLGVVDAVWTGKAVSLPSLINPFDPVLGEENFWPTILGANDRIIAPARGGGGIVPGDFEDVIAIENETRDVTGGNDSISANLTGQSGILLPRSGAGSGLVGDAVSVAGFVNKSTSIATFATLHGGDDTLSIAGKGGYQMTGDALNVAEAGILIGGNDTLTSNIAVVSGLGGLSMVGDAARSASSVTGGDDIMTGANFAFTDEVMVGDVSAQGSGQVLGGDDQMDGRAGQEFIAGDVFTIQSGQLKGGADRIMGGEDSDIIAGDLFQAGISGAVIIADGDSAGPFTFDLQGGADTISGGNGNDWLVGDIWSGNNVDPASAINGGDDYITGGAGDDDLYGDIDGGFAALVDVGGNDVLDGGLGNDRIDGQKGNDTVSFGSVAQTVFADLVSKTATGQGADILLSVENLVGSIRADGLRGSNGANRINGNDGNDGLFGRNGADTLIGGAGDDRLQGDGGSDSMTGGTGSDTFIMGPSVTGGTQTDRVIDFENGIDRLDLVSYHFSTFAEVKALTNSMSGGIRIDLPGAELLLVSGITLAQFTADDVILV